MNEAILKKVQAIYGTPSMESTSFLYNEDDIPALEAYSDEELELLHYDLVNDYTSAMETITAELANLELTIMLESVDLSLDRFNEYDGELSMEGVKKAVKSGKVTKDSAFKSIIKRIVTLFWTTIDNITGNNVRVLKYGKLLKKYSDKLDKLEIDRLDSSSDINIAFLIRDSKALSKYVEENNKVYNNVAKFSGMITPKDVVSKVYSLFSGIGIDVKTEDFAKEFENLTTFYNMHKGEDASTTKTISEAVKEARTQSKEYIKVLNGLKFSNIREKLTTAKKKMMSALEAQKAAESDATKKEAIQADLNRLIKLFTAYKAYNKKAAGIINKELALLATNIAKIIDAYNKAMKGTVTLKKTTTDDVNNKDLTDTSAYDK